MLMSVFKSRMTIGLVRNLTPPPPNLSVRGCLVTPNTVIRAPCSAVPINLYSSGCRFSRSRPEKSLLANFSEMALTTTFPESIRAYELNPLSFTGHNGRKLPTVRVLRFSWLIGHKLISKRLHFAEVFCPKSVTAGLCVFSRGPEKRILKNPLGVRRGRLRLPPPVLLPRRSPLLEALLLRTP